MARKPLSLSIALLMYNEEENVAAALDDAVAFCSRALDDWEILVIDDGSTDRSAQIVGRRAREEPRIRLIAHDRNRGMGAGIRTAIQGATKDYFTFNAVDGQIPASELGKLIACLGRADVVLSTYSNRGDGLGRKLLSRAFRLYLGLIADIAFRLEGLYLFPTAAAKAIAPEIRADTFFFSFQLIQSGIERGLSTCNTEIACRPREKGASKVANPRRIWRVAKDAFQYGVRKRL